jgi:hypothetical protein
MPRSTSPNTEYHKIVMVAVLNLILTLLPGHPTYYEGPSARLGKTYSNSLMVLLNSRMKLGTKETLQDNDFDRTILILNTSTNITDNYELGNKHLVTGERVVLAGGSRLAPWQVIVSHSDL